MRGYPIKLRQVGCSIINGVSKESVISEKECIAQIKSVGYREFYIATNNGFNASLIFKVYAFEYGDENEIEFNGDVYKVIRKYYTNATWVELTAERKDGKVL